MIDEYLEQVSLSKSFTAEGVGFKPKRPITGRKPNPIEQMQRFISKEIPLLTGIENSQQLKISKIKKEILERQKFTPEYSYNSTAVTKSR